MDFWSYRQGERRARLLLMVSGCHNLSTAVQSPRLGLLFFRLPFLRERGLFIGLDVYPPVERRI